MIILDTNVISDLMRTPEGGVVATWIAEQERGSLATTSICVAEILHGIRLLPPGRRREEIEARFQSFLARGFAARIFDFDLAAADAYATIRAERSRVGRPVGVSDAMIAGIARSNNADLATRNVSDFESCGCRIVDPWA